MHHQIDRSYSLHVFESIELCLVRDSPFLGMIEAFSAGIIAMSETRMSSQDQQHYQISAPRIPVNPICTY